MQGRNKQKLSWEIKRDKPKGTNGAKFAVLFADFADFRFSWNVQQLGGADFAENHRNIEFCKNHLSHLVCPFQLLRGAP